MTLITEALDAQPKNTVEIQDHTKNISRPEVIQRVSAHLKAITGRKISRSELSQLLGMERQVKTVLDFGKSPKTRRVGDSRVSLYQDLQQATFMASAESEVISHLDPATQVLIPRFRIMQAIGGIKPGKFNFLQPASNAEALVKIGDSKAYPLPPGFVVTYLPNNLYPSVACLDALFDYQRDLHPDGKYQARIEMMSALFNDLSARYLFSAAISLLSKFNDPEAVVLPVPGQVRVGLVISHEPDSLDRSIAAPYEGYFYYTRGFESSRSTSAALKRLAGQN